MMTPKYCFQAVAYEGMSDKIITMQNPTSIFSPQRPGDFYCRSDGDLTPLITSDEYAPYLSVIVETYGVRKEELELTEEQKAEYDYEGMPEIYVSVHGGAHCLSACRGVF